MIQWEDDFLTQLTLNSPMHETLQLFNRNRLISLKKWFNKLQITFFFVTTYNTLNYFFNVVFLLHNKLNSPIPGFGETHEGPVKATLLREGRQLQVNEMILLFKNIENTHILKSYPWTLFIYLYIYLSIW